MSGSLMEFLQQPEEPESFTAHAEHLAKRMQVAFDDLGIPVSVRADDLGVKITATAWINVPSMSADLAVIRLEDLAEGR